MHVCLVHTTCLKACVTIPFNLKKTPRLEEVVPAFYDTRRESSGIFYPPIPAEGKSNSEGNVIYIMMKHRTQSSPYLYGLTKMSRPWKSLSNFFPTNLSFVNFAVSVQFDISPRFIIFFSSTNLFFVNFAPCQYNLTLAHTSCHPNSCYLICIFPDWLS